MKKIIIILSAALVAVSCLKDLDIIQKSKLTSSNMWLTESDATGAMYGLMHQFRAANSVAMIYWGDYRAGTFQDGMGAGTCYKMFNNVLDATETKGTNWASSYTCINDANLILKHVPKMDISNSALRSQVLGSAYFIRAYEYFNIARVWGDAPLLLSGFESDEDDLQPSRTPVEKLYDQVLLDLDKAENYLPETVTDAAMPNLMAVKMLRADYFLWLYKTRGGGDEALKNARKALNNVLINSKIGLLDSYADVFDITKKGNKEVLFTIRMVKGEEEGGYSTAWLIPTSRWYGKDEDIEKHVKLMNSDDNRYNFSASMLSLLHSDPADKRAAVCCGDWTDPSDGRRYTWIDKFAGLWQDNVRYFISDEPVYRYAEALLMMAEIELAAGNYDKCRDYLNQVAKRAYGKNDYYTSTTESVLKAALINEYLKEFAAEGKSWWVYIRMGVVFDKVPSLSGRNEEKGILLWPIASACFNENPNMRQTEGYN